MSTLASPNPSLEFLKLLGHDVRWQLLAALAQSDRRVQELVALLQRPQNLISYHLRLLRDGRIVHERRSSADGRDIYYSLDLNQLRNLYLESGQALHPALAGTGVGQEIEIDGESKEQPMSEALLQKRPHRVLFLCTHNSARSQLAEGILRVQGGDSVEVFSAGSEPSKVHPLAIKAAVALNIDLAGQHSKHMDEFNGQTFNIVITVCDKVREICPVFPVETRQIHWSFPDPAAVTDSEQQQYQAFLQTARELSTRIGYLLLMIERQKSQ
jgi:protein-tyrosine-phosphatase/DNA-binding transcriptional ArsR family regulator